MNPSTIWHLFTTDVRRLRWLIIAVLVFLLIEAGQFYFRDVWSLPANTMYTSGAPPENLKQMTYLWLPLFSPLAALFAVALGWQGATAARLRPVRRREIVVSKFASLVLFLYVPQMLAILLVLTRHGIPFNQAALGMAAAAGAFVPLWIILAAYGRLAGTMWRFLGAAGATIAVLGMLTVAFKNFERGPITVLSLVCNDGWGRYAGPMAWSILWSSALLLLALTAFTIRRWKPFWRCAVAAIGVFAITFGMRNVDWFTLKPTDVAKELITQEALDRIQIVAPTEFEVKENPQPNRKTLLVSGQLRTRGLPPGVFCLWGRPDESRLRNGNRLISLPLGGPIRNSHPGLSQVFPRFGNRELDEVLLRSLPKDSPLSLQLQNGFIYATLAESDQGVDWVHSFEVSPSETFQANRQLTMEAEVTGTLYRYEIVANVPLDRETNIPCQGGWLQVLATRKFGSVDRLRVAFSFQCPTLGVADNELLLHHENEANNLWKPFLYLPESGALVPCSGFLYYSRGPILSGGAAHRFLVDFSKVGLRNPSLNLSQIDQKARLVILQPLKLGTVTRQISESNVRLNLVPNESDKPSADFYYTQGPRMAPNEFLRYARPRRPSPETATDEEFGHWLQLVLASGTMYEWMSAEFSSWVPTKLNIILRAWSHPYWYPLTRAIAASVPENQKNQIIDKLRDYPDLVEVLERRGWLDDARELLLSLYETNKIRKPEHLPAIASLNEPSTYERLIASVEANGGANLYNVLRQKPGIEPKLSAAVLNFYRRVQIGDSTPTRKATYEDSPKLMNLKVPLSHGLADAKRDAILLFQWFEGSLGSDPQEFMERHFQLPPGIKRDTKEANAYFMGLKPEDCEWDPLTRLWVSIKH